VAAPEVAVGVHALPDPLAAAQEPVSSPSRWRRAALLLPVAVLAILLAIAVAWPLLVPYGPMDNLVAPPLRAPSSSHWFGTDQFGRDVYSRVLAGTRISLTVGLSATGLALLAGGLLGGVASVARRWMGEGIMRCLDVLLAFPGILLAVVLAAGLGSGQRTVIIVLAIVYTPAVARVARALVSAELRQDYVASARLLGSGPFRVLGYHVGVNVIAPLLAFAVTVVADAILVEAALSFIGVGIPPPNPSWGAMINEGRGFLLSGSWWPSLFPGLAVFVAVMTLNACAAALGRRLVPGKAETR
jgi:ABC-type dipeptide/oligopeptide/nickel transport system permease subunit